MSVFDAATKTRLRVKDPGTDRTVPHPRSLSWNKIAGAQALKGVTGSQARLVHGERWRELRGTQTRCIHLDSKTLIERDHKHRVTCEQKILVQGNHKEVLAGACTQTILGPHLVLNGTVRNETRLGARSRVYGEHEIYDVNSGSYITADDHEESYGTSSAQHSFDYSFYGATIPIMGAQCVLGLISLSATDLDAVAAGVHAECVLSFYEHHFLHMEGHVC